MKHLFLVLILVFAAFYIMNRFSQHDHPTTAASSDPIAQRQQQLDQIVLLKPIQQHDAKRYDELMQLANSAQPNELEAMLKSSLWWKIRTTVEQQADDEGQYRWAKAYLEQLYDARRADHCFSISFPLYSQDTPQQIREFLLESTQQQSRDALTYILTHHGERSVLEPMQTPEAWFTVAQHLSQEYGADAELLNAGETATNKRKQCDVVIRTFEYVLSLPVEDRGKVLRWLLSKHIAVAIF